MLLAMSVAKPDRAGRPTALRRLWPAHATAAVGVDAVYSTPREATLVGQNVTAPKCGVGAREARIALMMRGAV
jgi:hypothetical protein